MSTLSLGDLTLNVLSEQIDLGIPNISTNQRVIAAIIDLDGDSASSLGASLSAILNQLRLASRGNGPIPLGTPTSVTWQPGSDGAPVTFDLVPDASGSYGHVEPTTASFSWLDVGYVPALKLVLNCTAYGRGDRLIATNQLRNSSDYSTANWTRTNVTVTTGAALAPNGDAVANNVLETTTNGFHSLVQSVTKTADSITYCWARYVKPNGRDFIDLTLQDSGGSNGVVAGYNLATGVMSFAAVGFGSGFTAVDAGIDGSNRGYYRCWLTVTIPASVTTFQAVMNIRQDAGTSSYAGDTTKGIYSWGASLQPNATQPGPYLETGDALTITNGDASQVYLYDVPGDCPALPRLTLSDVSTNGLVINDWRIGQRSVEFAGDYDGILPITPATGAESVSDNAVATTIASLAASTSAQTLGTIAKPSTAPYTDGPLRLLARVRDSSPAIAAPSGITAALGGIATVASASLAPSTAASSHTISYVTPVQNNTMVLVIVTSSTTITTPSGWTAAPAAVSGTAGRIAMFTKIAGSSEGTSTTISFGASTKPVIWYAELSGLATSSVVDQTATSTGTQSGDVMTCITGTTSATAQANEFAIACVINDLNGDIVGGGSIGDWSDQFDGVYTKTGTTSTSPAAGIGIAVKQLTTTGAVAAGYNVSKHLGTGHYAGCIMTLKGAIATAPTITSGTYQVRVAAVDSNGSVGPASQQFTVAITGGAATLRWSAPAFGAVDHYRLFYRRTGQNWAYFDTADATPSYILLSDSGATAGDPPIGQVQFGQFRMRVSLPSGINHIVGSWASTLLANSTWELISLGDLTGTPVPSLWGGDALGWTLAIDGKHQSLGSTLSVDAVWLVPTDEPNLHLFTRDDDGDLGGLASARDWRYDVRPDGLASAVLLATGTTTEAGQVLAEGQLTINTGSVVLTFAPLVGGLASDVVDCAYTVALEITPRWLYLAS